MALRLFPTVWFVLSVAPFLFVFFGLLFFFCFRVGSSSLPVPLLCFFRSPLFLLSLSFYLFLSLSSVFFRFFLPVSPLFFSFFFSPSPPFSSPLLFVFFSPLSSAFLGSIYRGQRRCFFFTALTGSSRLVGHWARLPTLGPPSPTFWQVSGGWSAIVSGRWAPGERVAGKNSKKSFPFSFFPAA